MGFISSQDRRVDIGLASRFRGRKVARMRSGKRHMVEGGPLFRVPSKGQPFFARMPIDEKRITRAQLGRTEQPRERADQITLDGAFEVARSIPLVGALFEQEIPSFLGDSKQEGPRRRITE